MSVSVYEKRKGREANEREEEEKYGEKNEKERQVDQTGRVLSSWSLPTTRGGCNKVTKFTRQFSV